MKRLNGPTEVEGRSRGAPQWCLKRMQFRGFVATVAPVCWKKRVVFEQPCENVATEKSGTLLDLIVTHPRHGAALRAPRLCELGLCGETFRRKGHSQVWPVVTNSHGWANRLRQYCSPKYALQLRSNQVDGRDAVPIGRARNDGRKKVA